jgi:hypothetical protein
LSHSRLLNNKLIDSRKTKLFLTVLYIVPEQTASKPHSHKVAAG